MFRNFLAGLLTTLVISFALPASAGVMAVTAACKNDWLKENHYSEQDARYRIHAGTTVNGVVIDGLKIRTVWGACLVQAKNPQLAAVQQPKLAIRAIAPDAKRPVPAVSATQQRTAPAVVSSPKKVPALMPKPAVASKVAAPVTPIVPKAAPVQQPKAVVSEPVTTPAPVDKTVASAEPAIKELTNAQRVAYGLLVETPPPAKPEVVVPPAPADKHEQVQTGVLSNWRLPNMQKLLVMLIIPAALALMISLVAIGYVIGLLFKSGYVLPFIAGIFALLTRGRSGGSHVFNDIEPRTSANDSFPCFTKAAEEIDNLQPEPARTAIVAMETAPEEEPVEQAALDAEFVELEEVEQPSPVAFHPSLVEDDPPAVSPQVENPYQMPDTDIFQLGDEDGLSRRDREHAEHLASIRALGPMPDLIGPDDDPLDGIPDEKQDEQPDNKHQHAA